MTITLRLVSVVIPCCDERSYMEDCLQSVLGQEIGQMALEIIVADGGSTDRTREILERAADREPRLKVIENPQKIVSAGLNAAIAAAKGQIIIRMDAHTEYASDYIQQCVRVLDATGADNVGGPWVA